MYACHHGYDGLACGAATRLCLHYSVEAFSVVSAILRANGMQGVMQGAIILSQLLYVASMGARYADTNC